MIRSGMKRGLAVSAISALAVVGVPAFASANPVSPASVTLYTPSTGGASTAGGTTVHLLAGAPDSVSSVTYWFKVSGGDYQKIATVSRDALGVFNAQWTPPTGGGSYGILATSASSTPDSTVAPTQTVTVSGTTAKVAVTTAEGASVGVYDNATQGTLLGAVSGTTTGTATPTISTPDGSAAAIDADVAAGGTFVTPSKAGSATPFTGEVDFDGYTFDDPASTTPAHTAVDNAIVSISDGSSDDAQAVSLYKQTITTVTATATPAVPTGSGKGAVTVRVLDQNNKPVVGAAVFPKGAAAAVEYTNANGEATFPETGSATGTSYTFDVTADGSTNYQASTDFEKSATVTEYAQTLTTINASFPKSAIDNSEWTGPTVKFLDQNNADLTGSASNVFYTWTYTPFATTDGSAPASKTTSPAAYPSSLGNPYGTITVAKDKNAGSGTYVLNVWQEKDGNPGEASGDLQASAASIKIGVGKVAFSAGHAQATAGTQTTLTGSLKLEDGTALNGRDVTVSITDGTGTQVDNSGATPVSTAHAADAKLVDADGNKVATESVKTDASGTFSVVVADPADANATAKLAQSTEVNDSVEASALSAATTDSEKIDFSDLQAAKINWDSTTDLVGSSRTAGRPVLQTYTVTNAAGEALVNSPVTVTVDNGAFITEVDGDGHLVPAAVPTAAGQLFGAWKNDGTSKTFTTDTNGEIEVPVAIEKADGFKTSDTVKVTPSLTDGSAVVNDASTARAINFTDDNPLNVTSVTVAADADASDSTVLPKSRSDQDLYLNVVVTDQFGNPLDGQAYDLTGDSNANVDFDDQANGVTDLTGDEIEAWSTGKADATQSFKVGIAHPAATVWADADPSKDGFQYAYATTSHPADAAALSNSTAINWYNADYSTSKYTLTPASETVTPGSTVTVKFTAVDQNGQPLNGETVKFFRSGPDAQQDGNGYLASTDKDGVATYVFQGTVAGKASVSAVVGDDNGPNFVPKGATVTSTVTFAAPVTTPVKPQPPVVKKSPAITKVKGKSQGKKDVITVRVANDNGGVVKLKSHGKVKTAKVVNGKAVFKINDKNGAKKTKYTVIAGAVKKALKLK